MKDQIIMDESVVAKKIASRNERADRLVESFGKRKDIVGNKWVDSYNKSNGAIRRTAIALKNMEEAYRGLSETTISGNMNIPLQNLMQVVRLSYPNMIYPEIFTQFQMESWNDAIYYIDSVFGSTKRDATAGAIINRSASATYTPEVELALVDASGAGTNYTGTFGAGVVPLRPYKVVLFVDNKPIAEDNGSGIFTDARYGAGVLSTVTASTIDYATGDYDVTFTVAPLGRITGEFNFDSEVEANFDEIGSVDLVVRDYQFRPEPNYVGVSWSILSSIKMKTTLNQDVESILNSAAVDAIRQNKDIRALRFGYGLARKTTAILWDANYVASNTYGLREHMTTLTYAIARLSGSVYDVLNRGTINKMYGTATTCSLIEQHPDFVPDLSSIKIGPHRIGSLKGIDVYQVPNKVMETTGDAEAVNDVVCVYKDPEELAHSLVFGEIVPMASTPMLQFGNNDKGFVNENGVYSVGDRVTIESQYIRRIRFKNIPTK